MVAAVASYTGRVALATYPGTVSPIRGIEPYSEAERDALFGRDALRDEIVAMVMADGFRAGLIYGDRAVGKTSLLRAAVVPQLRDQGVVAVVCDDILSPGQAFAHALAAYGLAQQPGEDPLAYLVRAVSNAMPNQAFAFVVDDADVLCDHERATAQMADLIARLSSRGGGRARFIFACRAERVHSLAALERRTGSLFLPAARKQVLPFDASAAIAALERMLGLAAVTTDAAVSAAVVRELDRGNGISPATLQLAAVALRELRVDAMPALTKLGGARELFARWLEAVCKAAPDETAAQRMLAELAAAWPADGAPEVVGLPVADLQTRAGGGPAVVATFDRFVAQSLVVVDARGYGWLAHGVLLAPTRALTAATQESLRRGHELLASRVAGRRRLSWWELRQLRRDGVAPQNDAEQALVRQSTARYRNLAIAVVATPLVMLIALQVMQRNQGYFSTAPGPGGAHVVLRAGRAGLRAFHWLPARPALGSAIADTGLTRSMVAPEQWKRIVSEDLGVGRGQWHRNFTTLLAPHVRGLWEYAATGSDAALTALKRDAKDPEDLTELLVALRPIARGSAGEIALVEAALATPTLTVQRAGVAVAGAAAVRNPTVYQETLTKALTSGDGELRRIALSAVRAMGGERTRTLVTTALAQNPDAAARRELLIELSTAGTREAPAPDSVAAVLGDPDASPALRDRARAQMRAAVVRDPGPAVAALINLVGAERAPADSRLFAIEELRDVEALPKSPVLVEAARNAFASRSETIKAAALPLYARVDPERAGGDLVPLLADERNAGPLRVASALAWGELISTKRVAAEAALEKLIKDNNAAVRAAAATAYGKLGRAAQEKLTKMVKNESYLVALGAAEGLAQSAYVGASVSVAVAGIAQLWKQKGRPRRDAAKIFAAVAKKKPVAVADYLASAARMADDPSLHPIGVTGLCNAANAGLAEARRALSRSTDDPSSEVRRLVIHCVAEGPEPQKNGVAIATRLVRDADSEIRAEAATILALSVGKGSKASAGVAEALVELIEDSDRDVRLIALRAISGLGADAPKTAAPAMARLFERGDEGEKLALVRAARQTGAAELVAIAVADTSPVVRVEAVDASLASGTRVAETLSAAIADSDAGVRRAALLRLTSQKNNVDAATIERALALAARDVDPEIAQLALTTYARVAPKEAVEARLARALASRVERERAAAAAAAIGFVERDAATATQLLEPLLDDASRDVRVAMLPALAAAYAKTNSAEQLAGLLGRTENAAMRRLAVAAAFVVVGRSETGQAAAIAALGSLGKRSGPMVRIICELAIGLIRENADGIAFLQYIVP